MVIEIAYKGANCITVQTKQLLIVDPEVEAKSTIKKLIDKSRLQLATQTRLVVEPVEEAEQLIFDGPGEYEAGDISITGVAAQAQLDETGKAATMFRVVCAGELTIGIIGHVLGDVISDDQLEVLGLIDVLVIPVGGGGYTLDAHAAVKLVRRIDPRVVIPTHYKEDGVSYEVPQDSLDSFTKELGLEAQQEQTLKIKNGALPESLTIIQLARTA
jgi:L-ascorbate metabolism protein UlaG (beta-lactamase superfamily)